MSTLKFGSRYPSIKTQLQQVMELVGALDVGDFKNVRRAIEGKY